MLFTVMLLWLVLSLSMCAVNGYPDGAPAEACTSLTPMHGAHQSSEEMNPFMIDIIQFRNASGKCYYYVPGKEYNITLTSSNDNELFKGFFIQARRVTNDDAEDDTTAMGEFSDPDIGRFHSCDPIYGGVTHNISAHHEHDEKRSLQKKDEDELIHSATFTWKAPAKDTGSISFRFTVVKEFDEFWVNAETDMISEGECTGSGAAGSLQVTTSLMLMFCGILFYFMMA